MNAYIAKQAWVPDEPEVKPSKKNKTVTKQKQKPASKAKSSSKVAKTSKKDAPDKEKKKAKQPVFFLSPTLAKVVGAEKMSRQQVSETCSNSAKSSFIKSQITKIERAQNRFAEGEQPLYHLGVVIYNPFAPRTSPYTLVLSLFPQYIFLGNC